MMESEQKPRFEGDPKRIRLVSNSIGYGPQPAPDKEVEQRLTIASDGRVFYSSYNYGDGIKYHKTRSASGKIAAETAKQLLEQVGNFFASPETDLSACDAGCWVLAITNTDDMTFLFRGALCCTDFDLSEIASSIREALDMPQLYLFDCECSKDRIEKVAIEYEMSDTLKSPARANEEPKEVQLSYRERILINRKAGTVVQLQLFGNGFEISKEFHAGTAVTELLNDIYSEDLFATIPGPFPDAVANTEGHRDYRMSVEFLYGPPCELAGTFDKNGLPTDFPKFAEAVLGFIQHFCSAQEVLSSHIYGKAQRRINDYIYLSVAFDEYGKEYYYRTTDETLEPGDLCIVPAGKDNHEAIARVVAVEYYSKEEVPLPLEKTKSVKGRYESEKGEH